METNHTNISRLLYLLYCVLTISIHSRSQLLAFLKVINKEIKLLNCLIMVYSKKTKTKHWAHASFFPLEKNREETCHASPASLGGFVSMGLQKKHQYVCHIQVVCITQAK